MIKDALGLEDSTFLALPLPSGSLLSSLSLSPSLSSLSSSLLLPPLPSFLLNLLACKIRLLPASCQDAESFAQARQAVVGQRKRETKNQMRGVSVSVTRGQWKKGGGEVRGMRRWRRAFNHSEREGKRWKKGKEGGQPFCAA